jgi:hypothetical protein
VGLALVLSGCIFGDCDGPDVPTPTACEGTVDPMATVDELALFSGGAEPLMDGDATEIEVGFQGSPMLKIGVGWRAASAYECAHVRLTVSHLDGRDASAQEHDVMAYEVAPYQVTSTFYVIIGDDWGDRMRVTAEAFGTTITREVRIGGWSPPDAGMDAGTDAGSDAGSDAGAIDAGFDGGDDAGADDASMADAGFDAGP